MKKTPAQDRELQKLLADYERDSQDFWIWAVGKGIAPAQALHLTNFWKQHSLKASPESSDSFGPRGDSPLTCTGFLGMRPSQAARRTVSLNDVPSSLLSQKSASVPDSTKDKLTGDS